MTRRYETLGRRILTILAEGARKPNVLRALANSDQHFKRTVRRLRDAGLIVLRHRRGGPHYALARR